MCACTDSSSYTITYEYVRVVVDVRTLKETEVFSEWLKQPRMTIGWSIEWTCVWERERERKEMNIERTRLSCEEEKWVLFGFIG